MSDSDGALISSIKYTPYGKTKAGDVPTYKKFTGQRLDSTGLYFYNARYYDSTIGRFISADTIVPNPANPQSFNRYSYVLNNPLRYTDPSGHMLLFPPPIRIPIPPPPPPPPEPPEVTTMSSPQVFVAAWDFGGQREPDNLSEFVAGGVMSWFLIPIVGNYVLSNINPNIPRRNMASDIISVDTTVTQYKSGITVVEASINHYQESLFQIPEVNVEIKGISEDPTDYPGLPFIKSDKMDKRGATVAGQSLSAPGSSTPPAYSDHYSTTFFNVPQVSKWSSMTVSFKIYSNPFETGRLPKDTAQNLHYMEFHILSGGVYVK